MKTGGLMLVGIGAFLAVVSGAYWFLGYEEAGAVMLLLAAGLALTIGIYLVAVTRGQPTVPPADTGGHGGHGDGEPYLPHASVWPLGLGAGGVVLANGLALGLWAVVPGVILMAGSLVGYARQSRNRD